MADKLKTCEKIDDAAKSNIANSLYNDVVDLGGKFLLVDPLLPKMNSYLQLTKKEVEKHIHIMIKEWVDKNNNTGSKHHYNMRDRKKR
jgi:hypothetical protein